MSLQNCSSDPECIDAHFKRKRKTAEPQEPALWGFALRAVVDQLAQERPEEFVHYITRDAKIRALLTEELVRKHHPGPQLSDSDLIEVYDCFRTDASFPGYDQWFAPVADLPWRLRMVFKCEYVHAASMYRDDGVFPSEGCITNDGRIEYNVNDQYFMGLMADMYINMVAELATTEGIPTNDNLEGTKLDDVLDFDLIAKFPHLHANTMLYDAHQYNYLEGGAHELRMQFQSDWDDYFFMKRHRAESFTADQVSLLATWVRKPKLRFLVGATPCACA